MFTASLARALENRLLGPVLHRFPGDGLEGPSWCLPSLAPQVVSIVHVDTRDLPMSADSDSGL